MMLIMITITIINIVTIVSNIVIAIITYDLL